MPLWLSFAENDLVDATLNMSQQYATIKVNSTIGCIRQSIASAGEAAPGRLCPFLLSLPVQQLSGHTGGRRESNVGPQR